MRTLMRSGFGGTDGVEIPLVGADDMFPPTALLVLGGLVTLGAIGGCVLYLRSFFRTLDVRKHGKRVPATVTKINAELVLLKKGRYTTSYFVHATWEDPETHKIYNFKSAAGGIYLPINHPPGSSIDVLIDPKNPRRYEVVLRLEERSSG
jgi:hypothetical protein